MREESGKKQINVDCSASDSARLSKRTGEARRGKGAEMAEFSPTERLMKVALGPALFGGWWYFAPDYSS